ncbi:MAG: hypothetical protein EOS23_27380 [Mesorhizobium sp.]|nr:MAG: hypothetical protein EOS23_27380 [Mesorhizobium sp.]
MPFPNIASGRETVAKSPHYHPVGREGLDRSRHDNRSDQWRKRTGARRSRARGQVLRRLRRLIAAAKRKRQGFDATRYRACHDARRQNPLALGVGQFRISEYDWLCRHKGVW